MNLILTCSALFLASVMFAGCTTQNEEPPKTHTETDSELRSGKVPDNLRDPRPDMPPVGPLGIPMR
ncbi:MAG: hypothetical protein U1F71_16175 [Verrucomicrobiaceae bacterium]